MAENRFSQLDPRVPLPRAEVRQVGDGWAMPHGTTIRDDVVTHLPLHSLPPAPPPPVVALKPAPSEDQLRETLEHRRRQ